MAYMTKLVSGVVHYQIKDISTEQTVAYCLHVGGKEILTVSCPVEVTDRILETSRQLAAGHTGNPAQFVRWSMINYLESWAKFVDQSPLQSWGFQSDDDNLRWMLFCAHQGKATLYLLSGKEKREELQTISNTIDEVKQELHDRLLEFLQQEETNP